jgi:hypothetical protein
MGAFEGEGYASPHVCVLDLSWQNAFSERLGDEDFDFFNMLAPDLLHEFELGVWKSIFTHLIRVLYAVDAAHVLLLDVR